MLELLRAVSRSSWYRCSTGLGTLQCHIQWPPARCAQLCRQLVVTAASIVSFSTHVMHVCRKKSALDHRDAAAYLGCWWHWDKGSGSLLLFLYAHLNSECVVCMVACKPYVLKATKVHEALQGCKVRLYLDSPASLPCVSSARHGRYLCILRALRNQHSLDAQSCTCLTASAAMSILSAAC